MTKELKEKAINIKGKQYVLVSDRVLYFNEEYPNGCIQTSYVLDNDTYIVTATVIPDVDKPDRKFIDHSQAIIGDGMVNKTASLENASTSAVGRALAYMGIGVIESIASADEMNKATGSSGNRLATEKQIEWMRTTVGKYFNLDNAEDMDDTIQTILTIKPQQVPLSKVKDAVDKIIADGEAFKRNSITKVNVDGTELNLDELPY